jgi:hypothetical protein
MDKDTTLFSRRTPPSGKRENEVIYRATWLDYSTADGPDYGVEFDTLLGIEKLPPGSALDNLVSGQTVQAVQGANTGTYTLAGDPNYNYDGVSIFVFSEVCTSTDPINTFQDQSFLSIDYTPVTDMTKDETDSQPQEVTYPYCVWRDYTVVGYSYKGYLYVWSIPPGSLLDNKSAGDVIFPKTGRNSSNLTLESDPNYRYNNWSTFKFIESVNVPDIEHHEPQSFVTERFLNTKDVMSNDTPSFNSDKTVNLDWIYIDKLKWFTITNFVPASSLTGCSMMFDLPNTHEIFSNKDHYRPGGNPEEAKYAEAQFIISGSSYDGAYTVVEYDETFASGAQHPCFIWHGESGGYVEEGFNRVLLKFNEAPHGFSGWPDDWEYQHGTNVDNNEHPLSSQFGERNIKLAMIKPINNSTDMDKDTITDYANN